MGQFVQFASCLTLLLLSPGCGGSGLENSGQQNPPPGGATPGLIGAAGGSVQSADGQATLVVPPNAVTVETQFTLEPAQGSPPSNRVLGTVYDIEPTGATFSPGALPELAIAYGTLPPGDDASTLTVGTLVNGQWADVAGSQVDQVNQTVSVSLTHLSPYALLRPAHDPGPNENHSPIANAGGPYFGEVQQPVTFSAAGSVDLDNDVLTYTWDFGDGSPASSGPLQTATHTYVSLGSFTITLTVSDDRGGSATATAAVTITASPSSNHPPIANAGGPYTATAGEPLVLNASGSSDPDLDVLTYTWAFGDASAPADVSTPSTTHVYAAAGSFTVTLTVSDGHGAADTAATTAEISAPPPVNHAPVILRSTIPTTGFTGQVLTFGAAASDQDNDTLTYSWTFGDGSSTPPSPAATAVHQYTGEGTFEVTLTVSDGHGEAASVFAMTSVTIAPSPVAFPQQLTVFKRQTVTNYLPQYAVVLSGSGVPPLSYRIVAIPANQDGPMDMVAGTAYQWPDPTATSTLNWRAECLTRLPPQSCRAASSSHVDLTVDSAGQLNGRVTMTPSDSPVTVIYRPQVCWAWIGPLTDTLVFTVTDATGATSPPATVSVAVDDRVGCIAPSF